MAETIQDTNVANVTDEMITRAQTGALPEGGVQVAEAVKTDGTQEIAQGTGMVDTNAPSVSVKTDTLPAIAVTPTTMDTTKAGVTSTAQDVQQAADSTQAVTGTVSQDARMTGATIDPRDTQVGQVQAATLDQAQTVQAPAPMQVQQDELISGSAVDMGKVDQALSQVQAATAQPTVEATVQGQMANLMADFDAGNPPAWAAGAMRSATAMLAARGLSASSMAGQAIIQAAMESATPIAQADAQTIASFEAQNLSNRQQAAMLAAEQRAKFLGQEFDQNFQARVQNAARIADVANQNFNAETQIALENSRMAQSVDLANLNNRQAVVMAEAAQIANLETQNLSNIQQAQVQNAQSFLQMDMANLANEQQTELFKSQSIINSIMTDAAAQNAAEQFNASSENQTNQFMANLNAQVKQFNATQSNAMKQFNVNTELAVDQFNADMKNQRDQFNAQNEMVIAQSNVTWRRNVATADTAAINLANQNNAQAVLAVSTQAYNNLWQQQSDLMEWAWTSGENAEDRINKLATATLAANSEIKAAEIRADAEASAAIGSGVMDWLDGVSLGDVTSGIDYVKGLFS